MTVRARIGVCAGPTMDRGLRFLCLTTARPPHKRPALDAVAAPPQQSLYNPQELLDGKGMVIYYAADISAASRASLNIDELSNSAHSM